MKILHIANFSLFTDKNVRYSPYHFTDRKISNGLIRNGHCVWDFSYRDAARYLSPLGRSKKLGAAKMNAYLIRLIEGFKPDLILLGHAEILAAETLVDFRKHLPSCRIAQWWVDPFTDYALSHLRAKQPHLNAFFISKAPSFCQQQLATRQPPPSYYLPYIADSSVEIERSFAAKQHEFDIFFVGSDVPNRNDFLEKIENQTDIRCGFFGFGGRPRLGGHDVAKTIGKSKTALNLNRYDGTTLGGSPLGTSDRLVHLTGNGCLTLCSRIPEMVNIYNENEVVYYDSLEELLEMIRRYRDNDSERIKIARAGWERAHRCYNEKRVARFIVEAAMGESFSEHYEWLKFSSPSVNQT